MNSWLTDFRTAVYGWFSHRQDALMDLLDALSSTPTARSVVELSVSPLFRRAYGSVYDAIAHLFVPVTEATRLQERRTAELALVHLLMPMLPTPQRSFWLLGTDVTSASRPYARTLSDRTFVYHPNPVKGVKPITIGHQYSVVALLPEKAHPDEPPWVLPLLVNRVASTETKRGVGLAQLGHLLDDETLPFHEELCVNVADSEYSAVTYLGGVRAYANLITLARFAGHRTVYRPAPPPKPSPGKGHPTWFGAPMSLKKPETWDVPDDTTFTTWTSHKGTVYTVQIDGWHNLLLRGTRELPMHRFPFTLVRARVFDAQGQRAFPRPIWLIVFGQRRGELTLQEVWEAYRQRFDLEHFFRFGKQRLLMGAYQTPETVHEENWWTLVQLAYLQLWWARDHVTTVPRPWERYLPRFRSDRAPSPTSLSPGESPDPRTGASTSQPDPVPASPAPSPPTASCSSSASVVPQERGLILQNSGIPLEDEPAGPRTGTSSRQQVPALASSPPSPQTTFSSRSSSAVPQERSLLLQESRTPSENELVSPRTGASAHHPSASSPPALQTPSPSPSPSTVQRDLGRVLQNIGTPAQLSTRRGRAPGRALGERLVMRVRLPVIKKSVQKLHQKQQRAP